MASEVTSLGAHTDLWRPNEGDLSSMVDTLGWRRLFPPRRQAWDALERSSRKSPMRLACPPMCASSAARTIRTRLLSRISYRGASRSLWSRPEPGSSSWPWAGTHSSILQPTCWPMSTCAESRCRPRASWADANMQSLPARRRPTRTKPTSPRSSPQARSPCPHSPTRAARSPRAKASSKATAPTTPKARAALATLYSALMTAHMLRRLEAPGELIVEGGFTRSPASPLSSRASCPAGGL